MNGFIEVSTPYGRTTINVLSISEVTENEQ